MVTEPTNLRLDKEAKEAAYAVFEQVGLKPAQAINLFLRQVALQKGLPFAVKIPNLETITALEETEDVENTRTYESFSDLRQDLGL